MGVRNRFGSVLLICVLAAVGCGGGSSKKKSSSTPSTSPSASTVSAQQARRQYQAAVATEEAARAAFLSRERADARAGNLQALKGDAAQYRTVIFNFDAAVRKIQMPDSVKVDVNGVLDANKTLIADLDAIGEVTGVPEFNRFVDRANADYRALATVSNKVSSELRQLAGGGSPTSTTTSTSGGLSGVQARLEKAGYTVSQQTGEALSYPKGNGQFGKADAGLDVKTPKGSLAVQIISDPGARDAFVKLEQGTYPVQAAGDHVWSTGSPASGGLGPQNEAFFQQVVKAGEG